MKKWGKWIIAIAVIICFIWLAWVYVFVGTYIFPIAPYWVTQLPPNPPRPEIEYGEFDFKLKYEIGGKQYLIEDTLVCKFDGFEVIAVGVSKKRKWEESYKNVQNNELYAFRSEDARYYKDKSQVPQWNQIVIKNIENYKIVLRLPNAEYFMNDPEYRGMPEMPNIQVYNIDTGYYEIPSVEEQILNEHGFKIIEWSCDLPVNNKFR